MKFCAKFFPSLAILVEADLYIVDYIVKEQCKLCFIIDLKKIYVPGLVTTYFCIFISILRLKF